MKLVRLLAPIWLALFATQAFGQAVQVPLAKSCFQATTGITGMIGTLGTITPGSGGTNGTYSVPLTGGTGSGATAAITVANGGVSAVAVQNPGVGYIISDVLSAASATIGNVSGFSVPVLSTAINSAVAGGSVGMYVPGTLTYSNTWQDSGETILNQNPVPLDSNGCALIYGAGIYRQILYDSLGNQIWDQLTTAGSTTSGNPYWGGNGAGSANAQSVSLSGISSLSQLTGYVIGYIPSFSNTTAATLSVNNSAPVPIERQTPTGLAALAGGEISSGFATQMLYDGTEFILENNYTAPVAPGTLVPFSSASCPPGYLLANGSNGTLNMEGVVARGYDPSGSRDPTSSAVGTYEPDQVGPITLGSTFPQTSVTGWYMTNGAPPITGSSQLVSNNNGGSYSNGSLSNVFIPQTSVTTTCTSCATTETRAKSMIVYYCQKQ